jgi:hypothetical protein
MALIEQKVSFMDQAIKRLTDELLPQLTSAVESLHTVVANWNTTTDMLKTIARWLLGGITAISVSVIGARLIHLL